MCTVCVCVQPFVLGTCYQNIIHYSCRKLRERIGVSLLQLSIRLLHKDNTRQHVLTALRSLLLLKSTILISHRPLQRQIAHGIAQLMQSQVHPGILGNLITIISYFVYSKHATWQ